MSQDLCRERAGVSFETIAGATQYIAQLEAENKRLEAIVQRIKSVKDELAAMAVKDRERSDFLQAEDEVFGAAKWMKSARANAEAALKVQNALDGPDV